jgi:hypothetical protein
MSSKRALPFSSNEFQIFSMEFFAFKFLMNEAVEVEKIRVTVISDLCRNLSFVKLIRGGGCGEISIALLAISMRFEFVLMG